MRNWKILGLVIGLTATMLAPSFSGAAETEKLKVGILKMAALTNPWVAKREGIFAKNGLDVDLVEFKNGADAVMAQQSGDVDIVLSIPGTAFTAIERGFDLVAIFQNEISKPKPPESNSMQVLVDSPIKNVKDLAGKKIAISGLHSQSAVNIINILKKNGINQDQVQLLELPTPAAINALKTKMVDAAVFPDPYTTQLVTSGVGRVISWTSFESIPEQPLGVWFAKRKLTTEKPQVVDAFNKSLKESIDWMLADHERGRQAIAAYTGLDPQLVKDMPMIGFNYEVNEKKWQEVIDMMQANGELRKPHQAKEYYSQQIKPFVLTN